MKVEVLNTEIFKSTTPEILGLDFDLYNLKIRYSTAEEKDYDIMFENPVAFKLMDERDLGKYWSNDSIMSNAHNTRHDSMPPFGRHRACHSRYTQRNPKVMNNQ
jgi:hypothetical protein